MEEKMASPLPHRFNIRVYGLMVDEERREILISRERFGEVLMTKFPGGGLEFGEGLENGLRREIREELSLEVQIGNLFYVNEFLQVSAFNPKDQLLSIYYQVKPLAGLAFPRHFPPIDTPHQSLRFQWFSLEQLTPSRMSFPVDKEVVKRLKSAL